MRNQNMAAIALLLIVAVPLLLGFALNFEQTEKTAWQSTQTTNISDSLLNSTSAYYSSYNGPNNNQDLLLMELRPDDSTYTYLNPPGYNSISETPSTIPYLNGRANNLLQLADIHGQVTITGSTGYIGIIPDTGNATEIAAHDIYHTSTATNAIITLYFNNNEPVVLDSTGSVVYIYRTGTNLYSVAIETGGSLTSAYNNVSGIRLFKENYAQYSISYMDGASINDLLGRKASFNNSNGYAYLKITHSNGEIESYIRSSLDDELNISVDVNTIFVMSGGELITFTDVAAAAYYTNTHGSNGSINYTVLVQSSLNRVWADPAAGWKVPIGYIAGSEDIIAWWANGYSNDYVRMLIEIPAGRQTTLTPGAGNPVNITNNSGVVVVNGYSLGNYTYLLVQFNQTTTTVSGIITWPSMGVMPILYNTVSINQPAADFATIKIEDDREVSYRVDAAEIVSGYYPVTKNYTFNSNEKFPDTSYNIRFNSIAVYGDTINLAGTQYTVTDGKIIINDQIVPLLHAEIRSIYNDQTAQYDNTINGIALSNTATPATINFGGEWSIIAYFFGMEKITELATEWQAGGFGLTEQGTIIVALLVDLAVFLGLGFYGRRTGAKIGWLLALCGGAAFVLICML